MYRVDHINKDFEYTWNVLSFKAYLNMMDLKYQTWKKSEKRK